jgi:hypothetical protein
MIAWVRSKSNEKKEEEASGGANQSERRIELPTIPMWKHSQRLQYIEQDFLEKRASWAFACFSFNTLRMKNETQEDAVVAHHRLLHLFYLRCCNTAPKI